MHVRLISFCVATVFAASSFAADALVTASTGQPYGIATIEIPVDVPIVGRVPPLSVTNDQGRVLFPIANDIRVKVTPPSERPVPRPGRGRLLGRFGSLIRELASGQADLEQTVARRVTFLFTGTAPLNVRVIESNLEVGQYRIEPQDIPAQRVRMLGEWWTAYTAAAKRQIDAADYPPWVENYLVAMLSGRMGLSLPEWFVASEQDDDQVLGTMKLLAGTESIEEEVFRRAAAGDTRAAETASLPLPAPPAWNSANYPEVGPEVQIEPLASRVPPECCYIRYGAFENYLWFRDLLAEYGGDLTRMVTLRGVNDQTSQRLETQLNLTFTQLTRMLGPTIIEDQALVGRDLFLSDGASMGVLMKARNAFLLRTTVNSERTKKASSDPEVSLTDVKIAGRTATLLSSSDNRVRSFMAEDDGYFFFANSETLIRRFFEVTESGESLAASQAFRISRQLMPLERDDTIFAYFSPAMLQGLVSPEYMIEMRRRLHAKNDIALVHLARIAAAANGQPIRGIDELVAAGFLPREFGRRADGSGVIAVGERVVDTLRGGRGNFLPIADVTVNAVNPEESQWYREIARDYSENFADIDPIMIGVQRESLPGREGVERIKVHAEIAPMVPEKFGWIAQQLGPPTKVAMQFAPDDIVSIQAHVASDRIGPPTHLFAAIKDTTPPDPEDFEGLLNIYFAARQLPAYLGAWPRPGAIDRLPLGLGRGVPVGEGMSRLIGGLYRYTDESYSVLSFQQDILVSSLPFLEAKDVDDLANVRIKIGNLLGSKLEGWVNRQLYLRTTTSSDAGANFLNLLTRQLKVDPEDAASAARDIMGVDLQCSLGGKYTYSEQSGRWTSSAWSGDQPPQTVPPTYVAPILKWFRGANATVSQYADRLIADATVDIARN